MALNITIEVDTQSSRRETEAFMGRQFQEILAEALNVSGEAAVKAVRKGMMTAFDRPNPFTLDGVRMYRASARTDGGDPSVLIFIADRTASYVDVHVTGGVRRAGDPFTTRRGPIVPGPAAPRDSFGNLPRGYTRQMMAEPDVEWVILKPGKPPALVRRRKGQPLEVLALIVDEVRFDAPRFDFHGLATGGALDAFPQALMDGLRLD